jgi:uncharacterized protein HemX
VENLKVLLPYAGKEITKPSIDHEQDEAAHNLLDSALIELEGLITIRHSDQPVKSILTPEQAYFIKEQLKVKLEMVKIALVQQNEALYEANLSDARRWVKENFTMDTNGAGFAAQLDKLSAISIRSQLPNISQSLKLLRDITKLRIETDKALLPAPAQQQTPASPERQSPAAPAEQH